MSAEDGNKQKTKKRYVGMWYVVKHFAWYVVKHYAFGINICIFVAKKQVL